MCIERGKRKSEKGENQVSERDSWENALFLDASVMG